MIHVDQTALTEGQGRSDFPVESVRRLCCDGSVVALVEDGEGEPLRLGRKQRTVTPALRRALVSRDRCCVFPGCTHTRFVHAHHVEHWCNGGETNLDNLMLLCSRHHRLVHEGGYEVRSDEHGRWYFRRPDGRAIPSHGYQAADMVDDYIDEYIDDGGLGASAEALGFEQRASAEVYRIEENTSVGGFPNWTDPDEADTIREPSVIYQVWHRRASAEGFVTDEHVSAEGLLTIENRPNVASPAARI